MMNGRNHSLWLLALPALLLAACDDGGDNGTDAGPVADGSQPSSDGGPVAEGPLFLLHSAVDSPETRLNYFTLLPSVTEQTTIDYSSSLELPGRPRVYAQPELGFAVIGDAETMTLTRYDISADATLVPGESLAFQAFGVSGFDAQAVHYGSDTVAYYKDASQAQIIVWNPQTMEYIETIELPASLVREDLIMGFGDWVSHGKNAFFTVIWWSETFDRVAPGTTLVHLDTETNQVTLTEDSRCRELSDAVDIDGTLYFFSGVINAFGHAVYPDDAGQENCMLRISPDSVTFDADYVGSVAPALPENTSGVISTAYGNDLWGQVADLTMVPTEPGTTYGEWYATGWTWWRIPLNSESGAAQITTTPGAYSSFAVDLGDVFVIGETEADYSSTTLLEASGDELVPGITYPGFTLDVVRVR